MLDFPKKQNRDCALMKNSCAQIQDILLQLAKENGY